MSAWIVYLVLILSSVKVFFIVIAFSGIVVFLCFWFHQWLDDNGYEWVCKKPVQRCLAFFVCLFFIACLIPSTKQACLIYVIPKIANNEQVQKIPDKLLELGNKYLDEQLKDLDKK